jgi:serine/alanine adding enzyme
MSVKIIKDVNEVNMNDWYHFLKEHNDGNVFQSPFMYHVYNKTPKHKPLIFVAQNNGDIQGILLAVIQQQIKGALSYFSARSIIWGGPIAGNNNPDIISRLLRSYEEEIKQKAVYSQIRNTSLNNDLKSIYIENKFNYEDHLNILVDLSKSEEDLWKDLNSKARNKIRNSKKNNCVVEVKEDLDTMMFCYNLLSQLYQRNRLPLNDIRFFQNLINMTDKKVNTKLFTANYEGKIIAFRLALLYEKHIYDLYAASDPQYSYVHPNDLLPWEIFIWGKKNGYHIFDFGGAGNPDTPYGVRDYKMKFGGEVVNPGRYEKIHSAISYRIAEKGFRLWQKIKAG